MPYIRLNQNRKPCFVNVDYLMAVEPNFETGSKLLLEGGVTVNVDESAAEIFNILDADEIAYFNYEETYDD